MANDMQPCLASLAVWDVPTTVVAGRGFTLKAGVKSSANCDLAGQQIEVCDASGTVIATGRLGTAPFPDTVALYWTEIELTAPTAFGPAVMSVHFRPVSLTPLHGEASAGFCVMVVPPPEHAVTVRVIETETRTPIGNAAIRLGPYRATTGASGTVEVHLPKGRHPLHVWRSGFAVPARELDVHDDAFVEVEAVIVPEENADRPWKM